MKNICIQGLGFVGSAMSVAVASQINKNNEPIFNVVGIDRSTNQGIDRIDKINSGLFPFQTNDESLNVELKKAVKRGNILATNDISCFSKAEIVLVSINCDLVITNGSEKVALKPFVTSLTQIAENISEDTLVIIESTVPPGTCEKIIYPMFKSIFKKRKLDIKKFFLAHSYERVMPGKDYLSSILNYWRVFAGINEESAIKCENFFKKIINIKEYPLSRLKNIISSECGKVLENSYRAVNIAFMEEWGRFAEEAEIDLFEVIDAIRLRPTHQNMRQPGFGVGGYCLTKDPLFAKIASKDILQLSGHDFPFSTKAVALNKEMPKVSFDKIKFYFKGKTKNKKILLLGVSYREDVGDTRYSPSEVFFKEAKKNGAIVNAYDPFVSFWEELNLALEPSLPEPNKFDVILFAVPHKQFRQLDITVWMNNKNPLIFDANNVLTKKQINQIKAENYNFMSIGRG
tara:strand:- start:2586 stop:3962 length:1377 start_codon:yes stop_codon:yes gene_type:complete